ncbi:phage tail protein [Novosphingobium clariflavum]|uniref:Phage tail protein n=1 Tax=Novosphingobium clariflavum TaxID=2029884 RepID=A0ABV6SBB7_9SPHN
MLAALGMFVFDTTTLLFDGQSRKRDWRNERTERFGARSASQFTGPGDDKITIKGTLVPGVVGTYSSLSTLAEMADEGEAQILLDGRGNNLGMFTIDSLSEDSDNLIDDGRPRSVGFSIELTRVS